MIYKNASGRHGGSQAAGSAAVSEDTAEAVPAFPAAIGARRFTCEWQLIRAAFKGGGGGLSFVGGTDVFSREGVKSGSFPLALCMGSFGSVAFSFDESCADQLSPIL